MAMRDRAIFAALILFLFVEHHVYASNSSSSTAGEKSRAILSLNERLAGWAVEWTGEWLVEDGSRSRKIGISPEETRSIPDGWHLTARSKTGSIRIALADGNVLSVPGDKLPGQPISIKENPTFLDRIISAAIGLLSSRPSLLVCPVARIDPALPGNLSQIVIAEGVVKRDESGIDLSPVFTNAEDGEYDVVMRPDPSMPQGEHEAIESSVIVKSKSARLRTPVDPGVYLIRLMRANGKGETGKEAWILVAGDRDFKQSTTMFRGAKAAARAWQKRKLSLQSGTSYLRAFLYALDVTLSKGRVSEDDS